MNDASARLEECLNGVARRAPEVLSHCIDSVIRQLQEEEAKCLESVRRQDLAAAWHELSATKALWCGQYQSELTSIFRSVLQGHSRTAAFVQSNPAPLSQELSIVDDDQVLHGIEASRVAEQVKSGLEQPISELDALVSSALGAQTVHAELNPLHPDVFAQALRRLVDRTPVERETRALWMKNMAAPLASELQGIYAGVTSDLRAAGVQPARYGTANLTPDRVDVHAVAAAHATTAAGGTAGLGAYVALSGEQIRGQLLGRFLEDRSGASEPLPQSYYAQVLRELAELHRQPRGAVVVQVPGPEYRAQSPVDRPARTVDQNTALDGGLWGLYADPRERALVRGRLRSQAKQVGQVFGLEIVRRVVGEVAQDARLLAPVREAIIACEPVLLRYAMLDPSFFSEPTNPARQLIERIAQRSFRYNDEFSSEFAAFFADVNNSLKGIANISVDSPAPLEAALAGLEAAWRQQDEVEQAQRAQALEAVRFAEARQAEADVIARDLRTYGRVETAPRLVQDFLYGPWSVVLAHQRLTQPGTADPKGYWAAIDDLLWSVDREETLHSPARLFQRIPGLLATLREGLASLGGSERDHEPFFEALMELHRPALKLRRAKLRRDGASSGTAVLPLAEDKPVQAASAAPAGQEEGRPWMTARDLDTAGFDEPRAGAVGAMVQADAHRAAEAGEAAAPQPTGPGVHPPGLDDSDTLAIVSALAEGAWVDLYTHERWRRAQLIWASGKRTLFMFVSHGGRPHSMTRRSCERLVRSRHLRPVATGEVVSRALETLKR